MLPASRRASIALAFAALPLLTAACDDPVRPRPRATLTVVASAESVMVGDTVTLTLRTAHVDTSRVRDMATRTTDAVVLSWLPLGRLTLEAREPGRASVIVALGDSLADTVAITVRQRYTATVVAADRHSCALAVSGRTYCWGDWDLTGGTGDEWRPGSARPAGEIRPDFVTLAANGHHTCALAADGDSWCWGANYAQQIAHWVTDADFGVLPLRTTIPAPTTSITAGYHHGCALQGTGAVVCWGSGVYGATGSDAAATNLPHTVTTPSPLVRLGRGSWSQCGLDAEGRAWCWGRNDALQLGRATTPGSSREGSGDTLPRLVSSAARYREIASGHAMTCGVTTALAIDCWGGGLLGDGATTTADSLPHRVALPGGAHGTIAVGYEHACALDDRGATWCWGANAYGQLGDGTRVDRATPTRVAGDVRFTTLAAGIRHTCGGATDGRIYCWGRNQAGQLGTGDQQDRLVPTRVAYQP